MKTIEDVIATYFQAWNTTDDAGRTDFLVESCAPSLAYVDPRYTCSGIEELATRIRKSRVEAPSFRVDVTSAIDGYGRTHRYQWVLEIPEARLRITGLDVVVCGEDGRIATITSFFGALADVTAGSALRTQRWEM